MAVSEETETVGRRDAQGKMYYLPANYADEFSSDFEKSEEQIEFESFFSEMKDTEEYAKICVYRHPTNVDGTPKGRKLTFLFEFPVGEMTYSQMLSRLRDDYGSGCYRIQIRDKVNQLRKNQAVYIEAPKGHIPDKPTDSVSSVLAALSQQTERTEEMLARIYAGRESSGINFEKILTYIVPVATALGALGISFKSKPEKSLTETLAELAALKDLFSDKSDDSGESNFFSLMETSIKSFGPAFAQAIAMGQQSPQNQLSLPNPHKGTPPMQPDPMQEKIKEMKPQLDFVLMQAKSGASAYQVADFFVDNLLANESVSDEEIDAIEQFLQLPDCLPRCVAVVPELRNHSEWFEIWRKEMLAGLNESDNGDENPDLTESETIGETGDDLQETNAGADHVNATRDLDANSERRGRDARNAAHHAPASAPMETQPSVADTDP